MVFAISVRAVMKPDEVEDCHLRMLPVNPLKVSVTEFVAAHTDRL